MQKKCCLMGRNTVKLFIAGQLVTKQITNKFFNDILRLRIRFLHSVQKSILHGISVSDPLLIKQQ